jgi:hypothetical protein
MLSGIDQAASRRLLDDAAAWRQDIRQAFAEATAGSPVAPLGDGSWVPAPPPWAEARGPASLYAQAGRWMYGTFHCADSLLGPLWLVIGEVLAPDEPAATFALRVHQELMTVENGALCQPYYARHDYAHLRRAEVKEFLRTYYNQFTSLQDRETYTFWECYIHASQHKTHEEGWFLMQTRWMLWMEDGRTLSLLAGVPRRWLEAGKKIELTNVATYFGPVTLKVESFGRAGAVERIEATIECPGDRKPAEVKIRLPHPDGRKPVKVEGGEYDEETETVRVARFGGGVTVAMKFLSADRAD